MNCGVEIITPQCSVPRAQDAFHEDGQFKDEQLRRRMETVVRTLIERAKMMSLRIEG